MNNDQILAQIAKITGEWWDGIVASDIAMSEVKEVIDAAQLAAVVNEPVLRAEIDKAVGQDPDLQV